MLSDRRQCLVFNVGVLWPNGWMDRDETRYGGKPRPWPHFLRWEHESPSQKRHSPQFSAHVCCGQTAGWIKMQLSTEVGLGPGDIVLDGDLAPPPRNGAQQPPLFGPYLLWPNGRRSQQLLSSCRVLCDARPQTAVCTHVNDFHRSL